ncbi:MAG: hypothetical protein KDD42_06835, partial [Bdellovibrionales bacterium]|nr:hypothetical protein [Bdellovibrionales bacterium]
MKRNNQAGIYLVVGAVCIFVLGAVLALMAALGFRSTHGARFQRVSNLVALASLERFMESDAESYEQRADQAVSRANQIFSANTLPGFRSEFGGISLIGSSGDGGELDLGNWYIENNGTNPCGSSQESYPCFVSNRDSGLLTANAAQVTLRTNSNDPLTYPFCSFFNDCQGHLQSTSTASLVQRCMAFVLDVSPSTYFATHSQSGFSLIYRDWPVNGRWNTYDSLEVPASYVPNFCVDVEEDGAQPHPARLDDAARCAVQYFPDSGPLPESAPLERRLIGLPFIRADQVSATDCSLPLTQNRESKFWCNMSPKRPLNGSGSENIREHFRDDYQLRRIIDADGNEIDIYVDSFVDEDSSPFYRYPSPYGDLMLAFNAGLRMTNKQASAADKAMVLAMTGKIRGRYPNPAQNNGKYLSDNFSMMIQLTNLDNRGTIGWKPSAGHPPSFVTAERRPNFLDAGFFYLYSPTDPYERFTNPLLAINDAIDRLSSECPSSAQRIMIIATDGISSCANISGDLSSTDPSDYQCEPSFGSNPWQIYSRASQQLTGDAPDSAINRIREKNINLVVVTAGEYLGSNILNKREDNQWLTPEQLYARGTPVSHIVDQTPNCGTSECLGHQCTNSCAHALIGADPAVAFPDALGVMAELALGSGGLFCPLMPKCGASLGCNDSGCENHPDPAEQCT